MITKRAARTKVKSGTAPVRGAGVLLAIATALVAAVLVPSGGASAATSLRWEQWGENAAIGGGSEGAHSWISLGLYRVGRDVGLDPAESAGVAFAVMATWEVCEVRMMDAEGVSVQDLAANAAGIAAGLAGLDVRYSYATYRDPEATEDCPWLGIPVMPRNNMTYTIELVLDDWTLGYKYLDEAGDLVIGTTSMPVLPGESGQQRLVGYVGRQWESGFHCAVGHDGLGELSAGAGYRLTLWGLGLDLNALADGDGLGFGLSCFIDYGAAIGR
jgi:hypothetical protein